MKNPNARRYLAWLILLTIPAILMLQMEYRAVGEIGHLSPDARVYLSVADNFIKHGHFIQKVRNVKGMVVPPGVPFVLTIFRLLHFSNAMLIGVHVLMFGIANILLFETERHLFGRGIWAPVLYTLANLRCRIVLGNILVEHYFLFLLCLGVWLVYREMRQENKTLWLNLIGLALMMIRPVLSVVYLPILAYTVFWSVKNRKTMIGIGAVLLPVVILSLNVAVNYRETGNYVLFENYSGSDMYIATSVNAPIHIEDANSYMDDTLHEIIHDDSATMQDRNRLLKEHARENLRDHFGRYLLNGLLRGHELFLKAYAWTTLYTLAGGIMLAREEYRHRKMRSAVVLALILVLVVVSSFGVPDLRYSIVIWPMASIQGAYLTHRILKAVCRPRQLG